MTTVTIRPLQSSDHADWRRLWTDYLIFYKATVPEEVYATTWKRLFTQGEFEPQGFIALHEDKAVGLVHYLYHRSCWSTVDNCYLQDLFAAPAIRAQGLGAARSRRCRKEAGKIGVTNVWLDDPRPTPPRAQTLRPCGKADGFTEYDLIGHVHPLFLELKAAHFRSRRAQS